MGPPMLEKLSDLITGWRFAVFVIALCVSATLMMAAVMLVPNSTTGLGAFATDFKMWCFGYDPATGGFEWGYVAVMLINPLMLAGFVFLIWSKALQRAVATSLGAVWRTASVGLAVAATLAGVLFALGPTQVTAENLPFPAERLRTEIEPPDFELTDQHGEQLALDELEDRVVVLTAIYTDCHSACPLIVLQAKRALEGLSEEQRRQVTVVAVTLDPENDTPERLAAAAEHHDLQAPQWRLLTGEPDRVERVLDQLGVSRAKNPETDEIEHSNLFALVDRRHKIAYRLTLEERHEGWLHTALKVLVEERPETW